MSITLIKVNHTSHWEVAHEESHVSCVKSRLALLAILGTPRRGLCWGLCGNAANGWVQACCISASPLVNSLSPVFSGWHVWIFMKQRCHMVWRIQRFSAFDHLIFLGFAIGLWAAWRFRRPLFPTSIQTGARNSTCCVCWTSTYYASKRSDDEIRTYIYIYIII